MSPSPRVLVTGATGSLGPALLPHLLRRAGSVVVLIRPGAAGARLRFDELIRTLSATAPPAEQRRLSFVEGALPPAGAGLDGENLRLLARKVTHVLHLAADTRFTLSLAAARAANVETTIAALRLASPFDRLEGFGFASTLYVAGTRTGEILEQELVDTEFVNTYEQSKFEAERTLRTRMHELPICVYRVATLLGSSRTGRIGKPTAVHHALRVFHQGLVPMVPGDPSAPLELLDVEHAAEAVARLFMEGFEPGTTYHVAAGPERNFTLHELVEETGRCLVELDPDWARRGIESPPIVRSPTYALFERSVHEAGNPMMVGILRGLSTFLPQLSYPKRFDRRNTLRALPDWSPPHTREYYRMVLSYCLRTLWANDVSGAATARAATTR